MVMVRTLIAVLVVGMLAGCDGAGMSAGGRDAGDDAEAAAQPDEHPMGLDACLPCVIDVDHTEWRTTLAMDVWVRTARGATLSQALGSVCLARYDGVPLDGKWVVEDTGAGTGFSMIAKSDAPMTCQ
jgi:hypothetical protein